MKYFAEEARDDFYHPIGTLILERGGKPRYRVIGYNTEKSIRYIVEPLSDGVNRALGPGLSNVGDILYPKENLFDKLYLRLKNE